ncbi:IS66 family insertion sequence element accessory protein TnpB [Thalassospira sp. MCCC 1A01428]|uniref:IS66 family insertion sequence element accessory protein TnpB n=1 Tax=Thalassospira sp. MCCC 1A01428 TaxID=1470575 RepID=UPI00111BFC9B
MPPVTIPSAIWQNCSLSQGQRSTELCNAQEPRSALSVLFCPLRHQTSLFTKRLERGRFLWPSPADGAVTITPAQLGYLLEGIDWRHPQETWRPTSVG